MKVKVNQAFVDVHTRQLHAVGDVIECTKERYDEIRSVGSALVTVVEADPAPVKKTRKRKMVE